MVVTLLPVLLAAAPSQFALIVTYNGGPELSRPVLRYADDEGARYYEICAALDSSENVALLTDFDAESKRAFPRLVSIARSPTLENVKAAAGELAERVRDAKNRGLRTELTFVFSGYGDVDRGAGYLSLKGASFDGSDLSALLEQIDADRSHVILDSSKSFFVLSPGRGGRGSKAMTAASVGVFLSTSPEREVFEWPELQSRVFGHAVRSGLLGAADADGDGSVSYGELAAFVDGATKGLSAPFIRPQVFARGPHENSAAALVDLSGPGLVPLTIDDPGEAWLTIRDGSGMRWLDVHKEANASVVVRLPPFLARKGTVERRSIAGAQSDVVREPAKHAPDRERREADQKPKAAVHPLLHCRREDNVSNLLRWSPSAALTPEVHAESAIIFRRRQSQGPAGEHGLVSPTRVRVPSVR